MKGGENEGPGKEQKKYSSELGNFCKKKTSCYVISLLSIQFPCFADHNREEEAEWFLRKGGPDSAVLLCK